jgi:hypothetical protein
MKTHTLRGQFIEGTIKRLIVDDGRLTHAMRVTKFVVSTDPNFASADCHAVLGYQGNFPSLWDWSDNNQIAWASTNNPAQGAVDVYFSLVDPNHLIIRDLYIAGQVSAAGGTSFINYYIEMEAVDVSEDRAILQLIKERSQGVLRA